MYVSYLISGSLRSLGASAAMAAEHVKTDKPATAARTYGMNDENSNLMGTLLNDTAQLPCLGDSRDTDRPMIREAISAPAAGKIYGSTKACGWIQEPNRRVQDPAPARNAAKYAPNCVDPLKTQISQHLEYKGGVFSHCRRAQCKPWRKLVMPGSGFPSLLAFNQPGRAYRGGRMVRILCPCRRCPAAWMAPAGARPGCVVLLRAGPADGRSTFRADLSPFARTAPLSLGTAAVDASSSRAGCSDSAGRGVAFDAGVCPRAQQFAGCFSLDLLWHG